MDCERVPTNGLDRNHIRPSSQTPDGCAPRRLGLFSLPLELREQIYTLVLTKPQNTITMLSNHACHHSEIGASQPPLAAVNQQLRHEALRIFYTSNVFMADVSTYEDLETAQRWVDAIGERNVGQLRKVALCGWTKVPSGHVWTRRWVRVVLDLQRGGIKVEGDEQCAEIRRSVEDLKQGFESMIQSRQGKAVDGAALKEILKGFHELCDLW